MTNKQITAADIDLSGLDIIFEITRFCNMQCPHCIRGEGQRLRIKKEHINAFLGQLPDYIGTITFSGGEPALAVDLMDATLDYCRWGGQSVGNFWMATNGTVTSAKFFNSIRSWVAFCDDNEISGLRVSIDAYHDSIDRESVWKFEELCEELEINLEKAGAPKDSQYLIGAGRAADNYYTTRKVEHELHFEQGGQLEGSLYVNARGFVCSTCDISYELMDEKNSEFVICHVSENLLEKLAEFFNLHPKLIYK